jgi:hypothetical protein
LLVLKTTASAKIPEVSSWMNDSKQGLLLYAAVCGDVRAKSAYCRLTLARSIADGYVNNRIDESLAMESGKHQKIVSCRPKFIGLSCHVV